ncbi:MAG: SigE family RNA polymerase sigma factor [Terracoccus sp.]
MQFEAFVNQHGQSLLRLAYVLTGDPHRCQDLTQTALANAYRQWDKVESARAPEAYVRRMLVNAHLDWHRRRSSTEQPTELTPQQLVSVSDHADGVASRDHLRGLLATLAPRARTTLVLRYYLDLTDEAVAEAMGISAGSVRATASRALASLRERQASDGVKETP